MSYRDDQATLETRRDDLEQRLHDIASRTRELDSLTKEQRAIEAELAAVRARLERASARRLTLLDNVAVASPCDASWEAMKGDARVRFCDACEKSVYNLSAMPRADAERLLTERESSLCIRLYRRADGTVLTADCPVGLRRVRMRRVRRVVAVAVGVGAMVLTAASLYKPPSPMRMGGISGVDRGDSEHFAAMGDVADPIRTVPPQSSTVPPQSSAVQKAPKQPVAPKPPLTKTMGVAPRIIGQF